MRVRRSIWTFIAGEISTIVVLIVGLLATPLLLQWLGDERMGAVEAMSQWFGYVSLLEFGIGGALMPLFARALARRDSGQVSTLIAVGTRAYLRVCGLMVAAGVLLLIIITKVLPVAPALRLDLRTGCAISILGVVFVPLMPLRIMFEADQRGYLVHQALLVQSLLITGASLLFAYARCGISGQFAAIFLGGLAFNAMMLWLARDWLGSVGSRLSRAVTRSREWGELWNLNWATFAFNMCGRIGLVTDNIVVGGLLSPAMVVPFFFSQQLAVLAQRQLQGIGNASWAALVELDVEGKHEVFNQRLVELTRLIAILAVAALVPIVVYDREFISLWIGRERYGGDALIAVAALNAFLLAIFSLWAWCINGTGRVGLIMPGMIAQTVINLSLSLLLTFRAGMLGPLLGTTIGFLSVSIWYLPMLLRRCFGTSPGDLMRAAALPALSAAPFFAGVYALARSFPPSGWIDMGAEMVAVAIAYLAIWWIAGLTARERELWVQRLHLLIPGGSY
jgi:O-antigen/teichoic acid export membrane protein